MISLSTGFPLRAAAAAVAVLSLSLSTGSASAQTAQEGKNLGALAKENLAKPRPKPPFDMTGSWLFRIEPQSGMHLFEPIPKLTPKAQVELDKYEKAAADGKEYRDDPGACWPLGVPRIMTRFWPMQIVQLPTMVLMVSMFNNTVRWIYTDDREHPKYEELVFTYNGHSIGRWEGDSLVVDTVGFTDDHKWIQEGIPSGTKLRITERYRLVDRARVVEVQFRMTDPEHWEGEWVSTKRYDRDDRTDIEEHGCIYEQVSKLPSFRSNIRK